MEITKKADGNRVTLSVSGVINTDTSAELNDALQALDYSGLDLTIDFGATDYITSAGLRVLLVARKKLSEERMRIIHANQAIVDVFDTTGFSSLIPIRQNAVDEENYRLSISALLNMRLENDAERTAYIYHGRSYSWRDVDIVSHIIASDLAAQGVKKGSHVGICAMNSINWVFTFFATQKLGAIAVLFNPGLRPAELCDLAEVGEVSHLCYGEIPGMTSYEAYKAACLNGRFPRVMYDISDRIDFTERRDAFPAIAQSYRENRHADDASVIIFSSGSTGKPKAILSSSYNLTAGLEPMITEMDLVGNDINLAFLPMFHVFGFATGISGGLLTGYYSVITESKSPEDMVSLIEEYGCTIFNTVPTMMLAITQAKNFAPEKLKTLRLSILGGSATTEEQMKMLRALLPNNHFGNIYGMSENAAVSLTHYEDTVAHITQTVGQPVPGLELIIRDMQSGQPLPAGETGEICIRSNTMAVCYYKLAIEKQPVDEDGWLATGDLGTLDEDGYLHIVGRVKDLIICGGENISPGEIAEVIAALPQVADVKVLGVPHEIKGEVVAAAVILKDGAAWDEQTVRDYLAERLAAYKIPVHFVIVDSFPLLGSGKVDTITLKKQITEIVN